MLKWLASTEQSTMMKIPETGKLLLKCGPLSITAAYVIYFTAVLLRYTLWPIGDQTDVIHVGVAALPIGLFAAFSYPGGRTGAFVVVALCAAINALMLYLLFRFLCGKLTSINQPK